MNTERAARFLEALSSLVAMIPWYVSVILVSTQLAGALIWFGAIRPRPFQDRPGTALGLIYIVTPFYLFVLGAALYSALWPDGLQDAAYVAYGSLLVLICATVFSVGFWLITEPLPPARLVPARMRDDVLRAHEAKKYATPISVPPTGKHELRRVKSKPRERR